MIWSFVRRAERHRHVKVPIVAVLFLFLLVFLPKNAFAQTAYTWSGGATGDWQVASNWTPTRTTTATTDILVFDNTTTTVTNVPIQTIGELQVTNGSAVALQTPGAILTIGSADGLTIQDACSLTLSGANQVSIRLLGNNSNINGSGQLVFSNGSIVTVEGILKLNGSALVDFEHASATLLVNPYAELQVNGTGATMNFGTASSVIFGAAIATGQTPATLRFADAAALSLTGAGGGMLAFGYYYHSGSFTAVQPRILSGTGVNAAVLNVTGATKSMSLFTSTGGAEGIDIPGDLILDGGGTLSLVPTYANQNVRIYGETFGTNLLTIRSGTTFENRAILQSSIRMAIEGTLFTPSSFYNSRNLSLYDTGKLDIATMNFWTYATIDLYNSSSIHLTSQDSFIAGFLHTSNAINIHGTGSTVYCATAFLHGTIDFTNGSSLNFDNGGVLNVTGATCIMQFNALGSLATIPLTTGGGSATLHLANSGALTLYGGTNFYGSRVGFAIDGTVNITGTAPVEIHNAFLLHGNGSNSAVHISTSNSLSVLDNANSSLSVEQCTLEVESDMNVRTASALYITPGTTASAAVNIGSTGSLTVNGNLNLTPDIASFGAILTSNGPVTINGSAAVDIAGGSLVLNDVPLRINDNPTFLATSGTVQYNGSSSLEFLGSVAHTASGELATTAIVNLLMNNSGGVTFTTDVTVTGMLDLTNGLIYTTTNTLIVESSADVQNGSDSSYIVGNLQRYVPMSSIIFPIGDTSAFLPLLIKYVDNGGTVRANVQQTDPTQGRSGMTSSAVQAVWYLTAVDPMPSSAQVGFVWPTSVEPPNFSFDHTAPARWTGSAWESYRDNVMFRDSGYVYVGSITEFSPWTVFGGFVTNFVTQPSDIMAGGVFSPDVTVEILDPTSATRLTDDNTTQIVMSHNGGSGLSLTGTTTQTVSNGVATFTGLGMTGSQTGEFYLIASTPYSSATSAVFTFTGGPARLGATSIVPSNPLSGEEFEITVEIQTLTGSVTSATVATVVGANFSNPYLYAMGSTQATIGDGSTSGTLVFAFYNSSNATITTTLTITGDDLASTTLTIAVQPSCENYELEFGEDQIVVYDPGVSSLDVIGDITLELWMQHNGRLTGNNAYSQKIVGKGAGTSGMYELVYDGNTGDYLFILFFDGNGVRSIHIPQSAINQGVWTHLAGTYNTATHEIALYVNGQQLETTDINPGWTRNLANDDVFDIGYSSNDGAYSFDGRIDEVRVWNTARTAAQLLSTMYTRLAVPVSGLAGYWRMDEGRGSVAFDISGNGNHGVISGAEYKTSSVPLPMISGDQFLCTSPQAIYSVPAIDGGSYNWSVTNGSIVSGQSSPAVTIALAGETTATVSLDISKQDGCIVSTSMTATYYAPLVAQSGGSTELCFGQNLLLGGSPTVTGGSGSFSYQWAPATGLDNIAIANPMLTAVETTTYTLTVTDLVSGCQSVSTATITVSPVVSSALSLDGDGDYIAAPSDVWFNGNYTVEGWVNLREATYWARFIDFGNGPNADNIALILSVDNNGPVAIRHFNGSSFSSQVVTPDNLPLNEWVHLAFVLDGTVGRIYKNGELWAEAGGQSIPGNVVRTNNYIGHPNWIADPDSKVMFDDIRFWNVARTQEQIQQAMNVALAGNESGLQANYRLDEGMGLVAVDASSNGRDAAIIGNPMWVSRLYISGEQNICGNESINHIYSVAAVANTNYDWSVTGGTITLVNTTSTTSSVSVLWSGGVGTVSVAASSAVGSCSAVSTSLTVMVNQLPIVLAADNYITDEDVATTVTVTVSDAETVTESLGITVTSGNTSLLPDEAIDINTTSGIITLAMMPTANQSGIVPITVTVDDGCAVISTTFTLTVNAINDLPVASGMVLYTLEDNSTSAVLSATDVESTVLTYAVVMQGTMGTAVVQATTGTFTYTPYTNANGFDSFVYEVSDEDSGVSTATVSIIIELVNDAPMFTAGTDPIIDEDAGEQNIAWATDINTGADNESDQTLQFVVSNSNHSLFAAQPTISTSGTLVFTPATDAFGVATVEVTLTDNGGTANGGVSTGTVQSFTITVRPVNDAPSFSTGANQIVDEEAGMQSVTNWATGISTGPANESEQTLTFIVNNNNTALFAVQPAVSSTGTLTYTPAAEQNGTAMVSIYAMDNGGTANGGVATSTVQVFTITVNGINDAPTFTVGDDQVVNEDTGMQSITNWATDISAGPANESGQVLSFVVSNNNTGLFSMQPTISTSGTLVFIPATDAFGVATVEVTLTDNGGTANGGVSTSTVQSFTITVRPVNDAPSFSTGANQIVDEDAGMQSVANWATGISTGPANESEQTLVFIVSNDNTSLFAVQPVVSSTGTLTYTPAAEQNGTATVSIYAMDNGGIANGGVSTSTVQVFTIVVNAVNDAPMFTVGDNQFVNEDAGMQSVTNWATDINSGADNESGQVLSFVTSNNNTGLFSMQPTISTSGTLMFTPATDAFGVATVEVTLTDNGGTANGGVSTSTVQSFTITVRPVNDAPVFSTGANQIVAEDAGMQSVANWATGISTGSANESEQTLVFIVNNDNTSLFAVQPAVSSTGTLTYTPAAEQNGTAMVSIYAMDNGGTANGGVATSTVQMFTIVVNAVNDAPTFTAGDDQVVNEDAGMQSVTNWATDINSGADNESGQVLSFVVSNNNTGLFSMQPTISTSGTLMFTPAADAFGVATVEVTLTDNGGTANDGVSTSTMQSFTITVHPVNDAPVFSTGANQIVAEDAGMQSVANWATGISTGPVNESEQTLAFIVNNDNTSLFAVQPTVSSTGTLMFTPADNHSGVAVVSIYAMDNGGTSNGGISTSTVQVFTITVNAINDAPVAVDDTDSLCSGGTRTIAVLNNDTDIEKNVLSISAVTQGSKGTVSILPGNTELLYVPSGGEVFGWDNFTYTVIDSDGGSSTATVSVLVLPPVEADAGMDTTICSGSSIRFNGEGVSYIGAIKFEWSPTTGVSNPLIADPVVTPTTTTTYTLTVVDGFGCSATDQITVTVVPASVTTLSPDVAICAGGNAQLEATGGASYLWSPATGLSSTTAPTVDASPSATTTYTVQITTVDGCVVSRFVTVTVAPMMTADAGNDVTMCAGSSVQLVAMGGASYSWSPVTGLDNPNIANPIANPTATTTYTVTVSNAGGCSSTASVTVTVNAVVLDVRVLLEGPYNGNASMSTGLDAQGLVPVNQPYQVAPFNYTGTETRTVTSGTAVVDWVLVDLRSGTGAGSLVERHAGLLLSDGRIVSGDGSGLSYTHLTSGGSYYVVVWHRNHLSVMSSIAVDVNSLCELPYIFSSSPNAAYIQFAEGQKQIGAGVYGMIAGDADANGLINAIDRVMTRNTSGLTGYRVEDVSLDGIVNAVDRVLVRNNTFRVSQVP